MSTSTLILRLVILLPPGSSNPGELTCVSPQALCGPTMLSGDGLGVASTTLAILACQQEAFKQARRLHYARRLRRLIKMSEENTQFSVNDIILITNHSSPMVRT